jgi:hypothetical protein
MRTVTTRAPFRSADCASPPENQLSQLDTTNIRRRRDLVDCAYATILPTTTRYNMGYLGRLAYDPDGGRLSDPPRDKSPSLDRMLVAGDEVGVPPPAGVVDRDRLCTRRSSADFSTLSSSS